MIAALLAAVAFVVPSTGTAQETAGDTGWYIGGSIGQAKVQDFCSGFSGVQCEDSDTAWRIFGGYQVNRHFALELGYHELGEVSISNAGLFAKVEAKVFELVAVGSLPVADRFSIYGKLGIYRGDTDFSTNLVVPGIPSSISETNTDLTYGFGLRYDFTKNFGIRGEWQRYQDVGGSQIGEADIDVISIGVIYRF
jgi:OOP family OmpA-OmpF porin